MNGALAVCDTNVAVVANGDTPQASDRCQLACVDQLEHIMRHGRLALDSMGLILCQYIDQRPYGWPRGLGDHFIIWAVTHQADPNACRLVPITPAAEPHGFGEFPDDDALAGFDPDDRVFVATARASGEAPTILNASDTDWWEYREVLRRHEVDVTFLCPELMTGKL